MRCYARVNIEGFFANESQFSLSYSGIASYSFFENFNKLPSNSTLCFNNSPASGFSEKTDHTILSLFASNI